MKLHNAALAANVLDQLSPARSPGPLAPMPLRTAQSVPAVEEDLGLPVTRPPHEGFADYAYRWALGDSLDEVLADEELPGGDFVRQAKQVIDLLRQLAMLDDSAPFGDAASALERGVVGYSSV